MTQFLVEIEWQDPIAATVRRLLERLPAGVEQATRDVPQAMSHGFVVLNGADQHDLDDLTRAVTEAGAGVSIVRGQS